MAANPPPGHGAGSSLTAIEEEQGPPKKIPRIEEEGAKEGENQRAVRGATSAPRRQAPRRTPVQAGETGGAQGPNPQLGQPYTVVQIARASNAPPFYAVFRCEVCGKGCRSAAGLGSHMRVHNRDGN